MIKGTIVCDLDGTLADVRHRSHLVKGADTDWRAYSMECPGDKLVPGVALLLDLLLPDYLVILSGRHQDARKFTERWLTRHKIRWDELIMRRPDDRRPNAEYKVSHIHAMRAQGLNIRLALDDYPAVARAFEQINIPTLLVARDGQAR